MSTLHRLLLWLRPFTGWIALAGLLGFATIGSSIGLMATSAYLISKAALHPSIAALQVAIVGVRFFGLARGVFRYLERYVSHDVTLRLLARLRVWFYAAIEPLAPARLLAYRSGDLFSRIGADIDSLEHFYLRVVAPPLVAGLTAVLIFGLMAAFDLRLAGLSLLFLLLTGAGLPWLTRYLGQEPARRLITARAELNAVLVDGIQGSADLLVAGQPERQQQRVAHLSQELVNTQTRMAWITGLHTAASGLLANWATLAVLLVAIPLVSAGQLDGVYLALLVLSLAASFEAVIPLPEAWQHLETSLAAARRLFELVDTPPHVSPDSPSPAEVVLAPGKAKTDSPPSQPLGLAIRHLTFSYHQDQPPILQEISFDLPPGKRLAVVGPSGAGKSTLVNLLLRFWDYQHGEIELGRRDLRLYPPAEVRRLVSVVSQRTHLFNGTIRQNLLLARPEAGEADLIRVARQASLYNFVQSLPEGFDTWVGEQGLRLSGGERQRLAIARALLQDAPILILDEATANLDPLVEAEVMQAIHTLMAGRTTLLITHRLVGLETMDEILVLQAGRIVERGLHAELWQAGGLYYRLGEWQRQVIPLEEKMVQLK